MPFGSLWLPVVVSAVVVWLASAVLHMALKYHNADYKPLPNEGVVGDALRKGNPAPGLYVMPHVPDQSQMKDPAVVERFVRGPVALVAVMRSGAPKMAKSLGLWLGFCLLVSFVAAYVARHALTGPWDGMLVMRVTGTVAFAAYGLGAITDSIWRAIPWSNTFRTMLDGAIYALLTGITFRLLWP
jgi:hypothetical protein